MGSILEASMDRRSLEEAYMKTFAQNRPKLEHQGSDALLKRQCRFVRLHSSEAHRQRPP